MGVVSGSRGKVVAREGGGAVLGTGRPFSAARRHSTVVRALKVLIPVAAVLAVGIVAFLTFYNPFGRMPGLTLGPISFSGSKIAMEQPRLTGFRKDNRAYEVTATTAFQDIRTPNVIELKDMKARLATDDAGGSAQLVSEEGVFDSGKEHLDLKRAIRIWTEKGEEVLLQTASVDLKTGSAVSRDPVKVRTPTLTLDADTMEVSDNGKTFAFTGRVHATLIPSRTVARSGADPRTAEASPAALVLPVDPYGRPAGPRFTEAEAGGRP